MTRHHAKTRKTDAIWLAFITVTGLVFTGLTFATVILNAAG